MAASHAGATRCAAAALLASPLFLGAVAKGEGGAPPGPDAARVGNPMDCMVGCAKRVIGCAKETMECAAGCGQGSAVVDAEAALVRLLREAGHGAYDELLQKWRSKPQ